MKRIGITGGIGSGKSFVSSIFSDYNFKIFNSDFEAKTIINTNNEIKNQIIEKFGMLSYNSDTLNSEYISNIIFKDNKNVFTFSMHSKSNYPAKKSKSDLDIELEDNMEDEKYLKLLKTYLNKLNKDNFDYVFYIAGVDIHFNDRLGKLKITDDGIKERDELVTGNFFSKKIPLCGVLGGGYNKDFNKLVELHASLHQSCAKLL